jgi:glycerol uptake facilitator-like aquaporin
MDARLERVASGCFFESDATLPLSRRVVAEGLGTLLLMSVVCGSSIATSQVSADSSALSAVICGIAIGGALLGLIFTFGAISGGHFNPLITLLQWVGGERSARCALWYVGAQTLGALCGAWLARFIFVVQPALPKPLLESSSSVLLGEMVASAGLMIVVFGCARSARRETGPVAVAAWLLASISIMPSGSYANPAVTIGALASPGPVALSSGMAAAYVLVELTGAAIAFGLISVTHPRRVASRTRLPCSHVNRNS